MSLQLTGSSNRVYRSVRGFLRRSYCRARILRAVLPFCERSFQASIPVNFGEEKKKKHLVVVVYSGLGDYYYFSTAFFYWRHEKGWLLQYTVSKKSQNSAIISNVRRIGYPIKTQVLELPWRNGILGTFDLCFFLHFGRFRRA